MQKKAAPNIPELQAPQVLRIVTIQQLRLPDVASGLHADLEQLMVRAVSKSGSKTRRLMRYRSQGKLNRRERWREGGEGGEEEKK